MTQNTGPQPIRPDSSFPKDHVVSVIDTLQEAEQASQALQSAGYKAKDIHVIAGAEFTQAIQQAQQQAGRFSRFVHFLSTTTDEGFAGQAYVQEARQGHTILAVYVPRSEQTNEVRDLLRNYHAHLVKYFGEWAITDLP